MDVSQLFTIGLGIATSISTIYVGSHIDIIEEVENATENPDRSVVHHNVTMGQAISYPVYASVSLLSLYLFFDYVQYILVFSIIFSSTYGLYILLFTAFNKYQILPSSFSPNLCSLIISLVVVFEWIRSGNFLCHDLLGCALCILFISALRFPSLKIATITLGLLVLYDIFWVFFSEYFFDKNVMVEVATKNASNPVQDVGEYLNIDMLKKTTETMNLPIKLIFPNFFATNARAMMLGLGDIALPGALIAYARRSDVAFAGVSNHKRREDIEEQALTGHADTSSGTSLFTFALVGYLIGLFCAFLGSILSQHAQPALIYIVPGVIIFLSYRGYTIGRFNDMWMGTYKVSEN